jgi:hypothetical protein
MKKFVYTAIFIIVAIIALDKAYDWKHKHDIYQNCLELNMHLQQQAISGYYSAEYNPNLSSSVRQYDMHLAQGAYTQYTNALNDCKTILQ